MHHQGLVAEANHLSVFVLVSMLFPCHHLELGVGAHPLLVWWGIQVDLCVQG